MKLTMAGRGTTSWCILGCITGSILAKYDYREVDVVVGIGLIVFAVLGWAVQE